MVIGKKLQPYPKDFIKTLSVRRYKNEFTVSQQIFTHIFFGAFFFLFAFEIYPRDIDKRRNEISVIHHIHQ